jgi:hypothetical protein
MTDERWQKLLENGKRRSIAFSLFDDCFEQLGENDQDKVIEESLTKSQSLPTTESCR